VSTDRLPQPEKLPITILLARNPCHEGRVGSQCLFDHGIYDPFQSG